MEEKEVKELLDSFIEGMSLKEFEILTPFPIPKDEERQKDVAWVYHEQVMKDPTIQERKRDIATGIGEAAWIDPVRTTDGMKEFLEAIKMEFVEIFIGEKGQRFKYEDNAVIRLNKRSAACFMPPAAVIRFCEEYPGKRITIKRGDDEYVFSGIRIFEKEETVRFYVSKITK